MATIIQKPFTPRVIYHPGVTLAEKLEELGMSCRKTKTRKILGGICCMEQAVSFV